MLRTLLKNLNKTSGISSRLASSAKKFSYGNTHHLSAAGNYIYVDKTEFIGMYESLGEFGIALPPAVLMLAPRRFSKTTTANIVATYYDWRATKEMDARAKEWKLFAWKDDNLSDLKGSYYVMKLDFSGLVKEPYTMLSFEENFNRKLTRLVDDFLRYYKLSLPKEDRRDAVDYFVRAVHLVNTMGQDHASVKGAEKIIQMVNATYDCVCVVYTVTLLFI